LVSPLLKPMALGLIIGILIGIAGFIGLSMALDYDIFGIKWRNPKIYYVKTTLYYIYLHIYMPPDNTPFIGNKTLLEYIIIVRVQNPYNDTIVVPNKLTVNLYSYLEIMDSGENNENMSEQNSRYYKPGNVLFDAWKERRLVSYMGVDNMLSEGGVLVIDGNIVNNWLFGGNDIGSRKYYVISGVVELSDVWKDKFSNSTIKLYAVVEFMGKTLHGDNGVAGQLIQKVYLDRLENYTYVYNDIWWNGGFALRGSQIEIFYGGLWP